MARIYASLPLSGPSGSAEREVLSGAEHTLERSGTGAPELAVFDIGGDAREARAAILEAARARHVPTTDYGCLGVVDGKLVSV